eukprot:6019156-Pyramimonas_sp.AAC.1
MIGSRRPVWRWWRFELHELDPDPDLNISPERASVLTIVRQRAASGRNVQRSARCTTAADESWLAASERCGRRTALSCPFARH